MERPPELFRTQRLALRRPQLADAESLFRAYATDAQVTRFLIWQIHESADDTRRFLATCDKQWETNDSYPYVIGLLPDAADPFGMIHIRPGKHGAEFGYVLARAEQGNGYMPEALTILSDWCLAQPSVHRASAYCDVENLASARVMMKAGMQFEGLLRRYNVHPNVSPEPRDVMIFAKVKP
jgi:[ribosomal protein S5]-alanine N-acetyltransferase